MSQFEVIRDLGETLKELLQESLKATGFTTVAVSTDRPKKDNIKTLPMVSVYLYHLAFQANYRERTEALVSTHDKQGQIVEYYQDAPCYMNAHYAISVWGNAPAEENLLLGLVVKTLLEHTMVSGADLKGDSFYPDDKVNVLPNLSADHNDLMAFWRALNEEIRPTLFYYAKFRVESDRRSSDIRRVMARDVSIAQ